MIERDVAIGTERGLHAMAATRLAAAVEGRGDKVSLALASDRSYQVDVSKLMALLSLGAAAGKSLTITCDGLYEETTMNTITAIIRLPD